MIVPQQLTEGVQPGNLTFGQPAPQSAVVDNYSQSYLFIPGAGVYIGPKSTRIVAIPPGQATIGVVWQTPPGLVPPPKGSPPGSATVVWSDVPQQTTQAIPLWAAQSAPLTLALVTLGQFPQTVTIPAGIQSLVLVPRSLPNQTTSIFIQGVVSGDIYYDAPPIGYLPIVIEALNPNDSSIIFQGGTAGQLFDLMGYPSTLAPNELQVASEPQNPVYTTSATPPAGTVPVLLGTLSMAQGQQAVNNGFSLPSNAQGILVIVPLDAPAYGIPTVIVAGGTSGLSIGQSYSQGAGGDLFVPFAGASENPVFVVIEWSVANTGALLTCAYVYAMVPSPLVDGSRILDGFVSGTGTLLTIPAGRQWQGSITIAGYPNGAVQNATVVTAGAGVIPPVGTQIAGLPMTTSQWGSQNFPGIIVQAPPGNAVTLVATVGYPCNMTAIGVLI